MICYTNTSYIDYNHQNICNYLPSLMPPSIDEQKATIIDCSIPENRLIQKADNCIELVPHNPAFVLGKCLSDCFDKICSISNLFFNHTENQNPTLTSEIEDFQLNEKESKAFSISVDKNSYETEDLAKIDQRFHPHGPASVEMVAVARKLLEMQRDYSDTYYLFSHGMSQVHSYLPKLITNLDHRLWPKRNSSDFIFVRVTPPTTSETRLQEIFPKLFESMEQFNEFLRRGSDTAQEIPLSDRELRAELLCVDADLLNREGGESALYFYRENKNMLDNVPTITCIILKKFAKEFDMEFSNELCEKEILESSDIWKRYDNRFDNGVILVYAVPKTLINNANTNFIYTSHAFGVRVDKNNPLAKLEELVKGPDKDTGMSVRLLTDHLRPENGIKSFWVGEKKEQNRFDQALTKVFSDVAENFFQKVIQHCHSYIPPTGFVEKIVFFFYGPKTEMNEECKRLLNEK